MTYLLGTLALMVAFPCLVGVLMPTPSARETWIVLLVAGGLATLFLGLEAGRDLYPFAQFSLVALLFPGTFAIAAYVVAETDAGRLRAAGGVIACALGITWAVVMLWRGHHAEDEAVNVLLQRFAKHAIMEIDGVQWTGERGPEDVAGPTWIRIFLQNCVAAERTVSVSLEDLTGLLRRRGSLATPPLAPLRLASGEVGALLVPVLPGPRPAQEARLYVSVRARGPAGRRLRQFRAPAAPERVRLGFQLFAILGGHLAWGGGVRFAFTNTSGRVGHEGSEAATWASLSTWEDVRRGPGQLG